MSNHLNPPQIIWPEGFDERGQFEMTARGYLSHVRVKFGNGHAYPVFFIDPIRLQQDLAATTRTGEPFLAEPGLIVLPEVTTEAIEKTVESLWRQGFFEHFKPVESCLIH